MEPAPVKNPERPLQLKRYSRAVALNYINITAAICTPQVWGMIIDKKVEQALDGDRYAADFLIRVLGIEALRTTLPDSEEHEKPETVVERIKKALSIAEIRAAAKSATDAESAPKPVTQPA